MRRSSHGRHWFAPLKVGVTPGTANIVFPAPAANVTGIIVLKGTMALTKPVSAVHVRYDSASYRPASFRGNKWRTLFNTIIMSPGAHTLEVRITYNDASIATALVPVTVGASTMISGIALNKLGDDSHYMAHSNRDKLALFQTNQGGGSTAIPDMVSRPTMGLIWNHGTTVRKWIPADPTSGVSYDECAAKGWVQKTAGNADVEYPNDTGQVFAKFGDPNYIARVVDRFVNNPNQIADHNGVFLPGIFSQYPGVKGVMTDDTNASYSASGTTPSVTYPDSLAWRNAMFAFLQGVGTGIQDAGYVYGCNPNVSSNQFVNAGGGWPAWGQAHDGDQLGHWIRAMAPYVDVAMCEYWMVGSGGYRDTVRVLGSTASQAFREYQANIMPAANETGISWELNMQLGQTADFGADDLNLNSSYNQVRMKYLKAAFLLQWDPTTGSTCNLTAPPGAYGSSADPWNASWTKEMGLPLGLMSEPVSGGFLRRYQNGNVYLNANGGNSVTFPAPDNIVVPAKSAVIT